ncbi:single-stranded DNA-binding protein [Lapidilactobacillus bayanensis]|uniref:single-stranded DNA-binding protein n=1 Tax=Lapidilactobacillus bayanensis TaxID=2485998 RepID=UPI000F784AA9|nr:single-stranded DNA-binding protein [Lapidilactobacillus bayanensis]
MINRVVLVGRLTKDVDLRYTGSGAAVATFTIAVNRQFTNAQGDREADFIQCVIWRKSAENFKNFTHKGSLVGIDGRIQTRSYDNQQGQRVYVTEVVVDNFSLLEPKSSHAGSGQATSSSNSNNSYSQSNNTNNNYSNQSKQQEPVGDDPFANNGEPIDISDDDLPF